MSGRRTARSIDTEQPETGPALPQALLEGKVVGRRILVVLSGGNVDPEALPWRV